MKFRFNKAAAWRALLDAGKDVSDIAKETGFTTAAVNTAVNGKSCPKLSTIKKICDAIGVEPSAVCDAVEEASGPKVKR